MSSASKRSRPAESASGGSRFADCPCCGASVLIHRINEHLDSCTGSAEGSMQADPAPTPLQPSNSTPVTTFLPPSKATSGSASNVSGSESRTTASIPSGGGAAATAFSPIARAFGISTPSAAPSARLAADAPFMPQCRTLLDQGSYPGAGTYVSCDARRRNAWLGDRGTTGTPTPGLALAAVARAVLNEDEDLLPLLDASDARLAASLAALDDEPGAPTAALDMVAACFAAPAVWVRLTKWRPRSHTHTRAPTPTVDSGPPDGGDGGDDASAEPTPPTLDTALCALESSGLVELLPPRGPLPAATLLELVPTVAALPVRTLRSLYADMGLALPSQPVRPPASSHGGGGQSDGISNSSGDALAQQLCSVLARRRGASGSLAPLLHALGPCARMTCRVVEGVHRMSLVVFTCAHYAPEEAGAMLRGTAGLTPHARFGAAAPIAALPTARHRRLASPSALHRYVAALRLAERAEAASGGGEAGGGAAGRDAAALLAVHDEAAAALHGGGEGRSEAACAILGRVLMAGCAQMRRQGDHAASARCLRDAVAHTMLPPLWRAAAFLQWLKDLDHAGAKNGAIRLCEAAHRSGGVLSSASVGAIAEGTSSPEPVPPTEPTEPTTDAASATSASRVDGGSIFAHGGSGACVPTFQLSAAQLIGVRRLLKRLADSKLPGGAPRRWKKPCIAPLATAREVRIFGREASDEGAGGAGRRLGWCAADGSVAAGVEEFVRRHYLHPRHADQGHASSSHSSDAPIRTGGGGGGGSCGTPQVWSHGVHLENSIFLSIFALLMWDALFLPIPSAFGSGWQDAPTDLLVGGRGAFYARRHVIIDALLESIANAPPDDAYANAASDAGAARNDTTAPLTLAARLAAAYATHVGEACIGIEWARVDLPLLQWAASALGAHVVCAICRALADDYAGMSHGSPDLLMLASHPVLAARLVEVKGPNDKLSDGQHAWIDVLVRAGADVEVAYVERC